MESFTPISDILNRKQLKLIWNYWVAKHNLLEYQGFDANQLKEIRNYINQLDGKDKQFLSKIRSDIAKKNAEKRRQEQEKINKQRELDEIYAKCDHKWGPEYKYPKWSENYYQQCEVCNCKVMTHKDPDEYCF